MSVRNEEIISAAVALINDIDEGKEVLESVNRWQKQEDELKHKSSFLGIINTTIADTKINIAHSYMLKVKDDIQKLTGLLKQEEMSDEVQKILDNSGYDQVLPVDEPGYYHDPLTQERFEGYEIEIQKLLDATNKILAYYSK